MHFHADHALFFERRQSLQQAGLSLGLTLCVLVANMAVQSTTFSICGAVVGALLLVKAYVQGHRRVEPVLAWTAILVVTTLLCGAALKSDLNLFAEFASRVLCGVVWVLWLGTKIDWASLRGLLLAARVPESIVSTLDHALMHGVLTQREWASRRNTARLRAGAASLPLSAWARLLGEGALQSFMRLEQVEENALIRCSSAMATSQADPVALNGISVERGDKVVLKQINLTIKSGEWLLLCGSSGAGKSSLLRLLAGLDAPSQGEMTRMGASVSKESTLNSRLDGRVALLTQNPEHHFIASTVREDIAWGPLRRGVPGNEAGTRAVQMARALQIEHLLDRPCHDLSFGEQRRVALAGCLVSEPKLLLLDEPTSGLDPVAAHTLRRLVQSLAQKNGTACIWATHDLQFRPEQANRVVLLKEGHVIFDGPADKGLSHSWLLRSGLAAPEEVNAPC